MDFRICKLCCEEYTPEEREPKILSCGHTFCIICLSNLVEFIQSCPTCGTRNEKAFSDLPTNYAVLENRNSQSSEDFDTKKKKLLSRIEEQINDVKMTNGAMEKIRKIVDSCMEAVRALGDAEEEEEAFELEESFKSVHERLDKVDIGLYSCRNRRIKASFTLGSCSTQKRFLDEIVIQLHKRKTVYSFKSEWYDGEVYWGKLTFVKGTLYIHTFTTNTPSYPSLLVPFRDLQRCMTPYNFKTFITIEDETLFCTMVTSSAKAQHFIQLCSGEDGPSFKGLNVEKIAQSEQPEVIKIEINKPKTFEGDYSFLSFLPSVSRDTFLSKCQIKMCDGRCEIVKSPCNVSNSEGDISSSIVATSKSEVFSRDLTGKIIKDCGLVIILPCPTK